MEQKESKWDDISSDEDEYVPKQKPQAKKSEEVKQEQTEEKTQQKPKQQQERKKLPGKGEMIDSIKKSEANQISINIFRLQEQVNAKMIYEAFQDVPIQKIFTEQHKPGSFIVYFENKENAIHFVKKAPRPINEKSFLMRIGRQQQKFDNSEWNEIGSGGRVVRPLYKNERQGNKWHDKPKRNQQPYNRKQADENAGFADDNNQPQKQQQQKFEKKQEQTQSQNQTETKSEYKPRFYKGSQNKPQQSNNDNTQRDAKIFGNAKPIKKGEEKEFQQVKTPQEKKQEKKSEKTEKTEKKEQIDDGWSKA